jgi:chromosome segregation ATPase
MKLWELVKANPKLVAILIASAVFGIAIVLGLRAAGSAINEHQIGQLETEKQAALKQAGEAHSQNLVLQGEVKAKDETIKTLTSQIAESNSQVTAAHTETQSARVNYEKVRTDKPHFNSADDAGRVVELGTDLQRLYSDTP